MYLLESADKDDEARSALWKAICIASKEIRYRFRIDNVYERNGTLIGNNTKTPNVATWPLVEALCLLGVIIRAEDATAKDVSIFGKTGPIEIKEAGIVKYLWAQQIIKGDKSTLNGRPDLIITSTSDIPNSRNAIGVIEAKCMHKIGAQTVRSEFGKAHDLRVATYLIWSFYSLPKKVIEGAKRLGINIETLGFDSEWRRDLISNPEVLISKVVNAQHQASKEKRFAYTLEKASREAQIKLLEN
ncbi:MAG: hypothetical protein WCH05_05895 [Chlorobiaceae bacterium]